VSSNLAGCAISSPYARASRVRPASKKAPPCDPSNGAEPLLRPRRIVADWCLTPGFRAKITGDDSGAGEPHGADRFGEHVHPACEAVRKFKMAWISAVRPSRQLRSLFSGRAQRGPVDSFLRARDFLGASKASLMLRSAEEPAPGLNWGRVSKHAQPQCSQFPDSLLRRRSSRRTEVRNRLSWRGSIVALSSVFSAWRLIGTSVAGSSPSGVASDCSANPASEEIDQHGCQPDREHDQPR
jgi:hypothetical protein